MSQWRHSMTKWVYEGKPSPNELWRQTMTKRAHEINPWLNELTKANHDWTSLRKQTMTKWFHEGEARPNDFMKANHDQMTSWRRTMTKWFHEGGEPWPSDFMKALCVSLCTSLNHQWESQSMLIGFQKFQGNLPNKPYLHHINESCQINIMCITMHKSRWSMRITINARWLSKV